MNKGESANSTIDSSNSLENKDSNSVINFISTSFILDSVYQIKPMFIWVGF
jgi:hypothetical protein